MDIFNNSNCNLLLGNIQEPSITRYSMYSLLRSNNYVAIKGLFVGMNVVFIETA